MHAYNDHASYINNKLTIIMCNCMATRIESLSSPQDGLRYKLVMYSKSVRINGYVFGCTLLSSLFALLQTGRLNKLSVSVFPNNPTSYPYYCILLQSTSFIIRLFLAAVHWFFLYFWIDYLSWYPSVMSFYFRRKSSEPTSTFVD